MLQPQNIFFSSHCVLTSCSTTQSQRHNQLDFTAQVHDEPSISKKCCWSDRYTVRIPNRKERFHLLVVKWTLSCFLLCGCGFLCFAVVFSHFLTRFPCLQMCSCICRPGSNLRNSISFYRKNLNKVPDGGKFLVRKTHSLSLLLSVLCLIWIQLYNTLTSFSRVVKSPLRSPAHSWEVNGCDFKWLQCGQQVSDIVLYTWTFTASYYWYQSKT